MAERDDRMNDHTSNRANDRTRDAFDRDLERDNRGGGAGGTLGDLANPGGDDRAGAGASQPHVADGEEHRQKDRQGQAQSPRELTHNEQPKQKEGHR